MKKRPACSELRWAYCNHKATYFASYLTGGDCVPDDQFFFQAEDGIRYYKVTGVQTCALPISRQAPISERGQQPDRGRRALGGPDQAVGLGFVERSEERRVGKECRSRWSPYH